MLISVQVNGNMVLEVAVNFYLNEKPEYHENKIGMSLAKLYHIMLYRVPPTFSENKHCSHR